ncbi:MAG: TauD/TfdA family dioxygenase [Rhodospirillales bacterium]|nr:TauD/TfdA family dioxygenase [Rhodospirillales bacterium]
MTLTAKPLHELFAAELSGVPLSGHMSPAELAEIKAALAQYAVCAVGHDQPLSNEDHIAFSALLGPIEGGKILKVSGSPDEMRIAHHEIIDQSNMDETGEIYADDDRRLAFKRANRLWHTDMSFHQNRATWSLLSAHMVPPDGAPTEFSDMRAVYDALPDGMKTRIDGLEAEHSYWHSRVLGGGPEPTDEERASRPPARHKLVHVHEPSGRKALYIASHATHIVGWPEDEGRDLLLELMEFATRPEFVYSHDWRVGEVVIWDNLCTIHRATEFDDRQYRRDMRRTTCRESAV